VARSGPRIQSPGGTPGRSRSGFWRPSSTPAWSIRRARRSPASACACRSTTRSVMPTSSIGSRTASPAPRTSCALDTRAGLCAHARLRGRCGSGTRHAAATALDPEPIPAARLARTGAGASFLVLVLLRPLLWVQQASAVADVRDDSGHGHSRAAWCGVCVDILPSPPCGAGLGAASAQGVGPCSLRRARLPAVATRLLPVGCRGRHHSRGQYRHDVPVQQQPPAALPAGAFLGLCNEVTEPTVTCHRTCAWGPAGLGQFWPVGGADHHQHHKNNTTTVTNTVASDAAHEHNTTLGLLQYGFGASVAMETTSAAVSLAASRGTATSMATTRLTSFPTSTNVVVVNYDLLQGNLGVPFLKVHTFFLSTLLLYHRMLGLCSYGLGLSLSVFRIT
jgi:hypothetical protein